MGEVLPICIVAGASLPPLTYAPTSWHRKAAQLGSRLAALDARLQRASTASAASVLSTALHAAVCAGDLAYTAGCSQGQVEQVGSAAALLLGSGRASLERMLVDAESGRGAAGIDHSTLHLMAKQQITTASGLTSIAVVTGAAVPLSPTSATAAWLKAAVRAALAAGEPCRPGVRCPAACSVACDAWLPTLAACLPARWPASPFACQGCQWLDAGAAV